MADFVVCIACAVATLLSGTFPALKATDFLQDREATDRPPMAALVKAVVAMATGEHDTVRAGASLDLGEGDLQPGQRVFSVSVQLSVVPVQSSRVTVVTGRGVGGRGGWSLRLKVNR